MTAADWQQRIGWNCANLRAQYGGNILRLNGNFAQSGMFIQCDLDHKQAVYLDVSTDTAAAYCYDCALNLSLAVDDTRVFGAVR
jgi:hypothetical protein